MTDEEIRDAIIKAAAERIANDFFTCNPRYRTKKNLTKWSESTIRLLLTKIFQ